MSVRKLGKNFRKYLENYINFVWSVFENKNMKAISNKFVSIMKEIK